MRESKKRAKFVLKPTIQNGELRKQLAPRWQHGDVADKLAMVFQRCGLRELSITNS